jgi:membrane-associated phospholipid phosphatase
MPVTVRPTRADKRSPKLSPTTPPRQWRGLLKLSRGQRAVWWLYCRGRPASERATSNHVLITTIAATILPHLMKHLFTQERPDRRIVAAHLRGAPFSGRALHAFPSGHALHVGALASAACDLPAPQRALAWTGGAVLVLTRIFLLAHWASDVAAGLALGTALERMIRLVTHHDRRKGA